MNAIIASVANLVGVELGYAKTRMARGRAGVSRRARTSQSKPCLRIARPGVAGQCLRSLLTFAEGVGSAYRIERPFAAGMDDDRPSPPADVRLAEGAG
jgi:hypothetical protein